MQEDVERISKIEGKCKTSTEIVVRGMVYLTFFRSS